MAPGNDGDVGMRAFTEKLEAGMDLNSSDIAVAVTMLLSEQVPDEEKATFLTGLHRKGESAEEIACFVDLLMQRAIDPLLDPAEMPGPMIDVCGTGGDGLNFFNVSTTIMFVLAAGGAVVVKHGNRSVTSQCGSADVLEALRVPLHLPPEELRECLKRHGLGFIFAREYHPAFRAMAKMRERLARQKTRTIFNLLGPLLNPARPGNQLIGVFAPRLTTVFAEVLRRLGRERAWVVHGLAEGTDGMDDISICGPTTVAELENGKVMSAVLDTQWLGLARCDLEKLRGGSAQENATILEGILAGEIKDSKREMTVANAAAGFMVAGIVRDMNEGIALAREQIENGRALEKLRALQSYARRSSP
jgi:anthranilate phosphoribosyltransferase